MQVRWKKVMESFQRVQVFLGAHPAPAPMTYAEPKEILDTVIAKLSDHLTNQVSGRRLSQAEKRRQDALSEKLREHHLRPIAAIARASSFSTPGIDRALRIPRKNSGVLNLLTDARSIRNSILLYQPMFVRNGRPADFLEQLDAAIKAIDDAVAGRGSQVRRHVGAKAGIRKELVRGRQAVDMLDSIVRIAFEGQEDVLAEWGVAKRVQSLPTASASASDELPVIVPDQKLNAA
jgi:hypothetical protein